MTVAIIVTCEFYTEGGQWVGNCLKLGTSVCAPTFEETVQDLGEAVELHLNTLEDVGEPWITTMGGGRWQHS